MGRGNSQGAVEILTGLVTEPKLLRPEGMTDVKGIEALHHTPGQPHVAHRQQARKE
jgi:hypothetical protein